MGVPCIVYHLTEGNRTDYGWGWRRVENQLELDGLIKNGWKNSVDELIENIEEKNTETLAEDELEEPVEIEEKTEKPENSETVKKEEIIIHKKRGRKPKAV